MTGSPIPPNVTQTAEQGFSARPRTLKLAAACGELASLGVWQGKAARMLGIQASRARQLAAQFGFEFAPVPKVRSELRKLIIRRYRENVPPTKIAAEIGRSPEYVRAVACQLGLTARRVDPCRFRRGYIVPDHLWPQYKELRQLGLTFKECGFELGLVARPAARSLSIIERTV